MDAKINSIKLNEGLTTILAFYIQTSTYFASYNKVTIPSTVRTLWVIFGRHPLQEPNPLTIIMLPTTPPSLGGLLTAGSDEDIPDYIEALYVPTSLLTNTE